MFYSFNKNAVFRQTALVYFCCCKLLGYVEKLIVFMYIAVLFALPGITEKGAKISAFIADCTDL